MDDGKQYVDLSEKVTATYYDEEHEEWSERTVTIQDVLDSACYGYTVEPYENPKMICVANVMLTDEQVKEAFEKAKMEILTLQPDLQPICNKLATDCKWKKNIILEIDKTIEEVKHNGKYHAKFVRENGELVIFGLEIAKHIIEKGEEDG